MTASCLRCYTREEVMKLFANLSDSDEEILDGGDDVHFSDESDSDAQCT